MNKVDFAKNVADVALLRLCRKLVTLAHLVRDKATEDSCDCSHSYSIYSFNFAKSHNFDAK